MKKVYIVTSGSYSDYHIEGVFSTRKRAASYGTDIGEYKVDEKLTYKWRRVYRCLISLKTGNLITQEKGLIEAVAGYTYQWAGKLYNPKGAFALAESTRSAAHALKLAAEHRQAWLRENPTYFKPKRAKKAGFDPDA